MRAPIFGQKPQITRNIAPIEIANLLTTFVIETRPTFCENEVFGSTPKSAANDEPRPSQITPPESSESVASLSIPPSTQAEISPTVSIAVTINMIPIGMIALAWKEIPTSDSFPKPIKLGTAIHAAFLTSSKFTTHEYVYLTPSAVTPVCDMVSVIMIATTYPARIPKRMADDEKILRDGAKCLRSTITISTTIPIKRFGSEP